MHISKLPRLVSHVGQLIAGRGVAAGINIGTFLLVARILGPEDFGRLSIVAAFAAAVWRLSSSVSWQPLIKYGAGHLENSGLRALLWRCLKIDLAVALVTCGLVAALVPSLVAAVGWEYQFVVFFQFCLLVAVTNISGSATGLLRLTGRFDILAWQEPFVAIVRALVVLSAIWLGLGLSGAVFAWVASYVALHAFLAVSAIVEARKLGAERSGQLLMVDFWGFWLSSYLTGLVRVFRELDGLVIGALVSVSDTGFYRLARSISSLVVSAVDSVHQVTFPELTRHWNTGEKADFWRLVKLSSALVGFLGLAVFFAAFFAGTEFLVLAAGPEFMASGPLLTVLLAAAVLWAFIHPFGSALLAFGGARAALGIEIATTIAYLILIVAMTSTFGVYGSTIARFVFYGLWGVVTISVVWLFVSRAVIESKN